MSSPKGYPSQSKDARVGAQFATVEPVGQSQYGLSTLAHVFHYVVASDAVEANADPLTNQYRIKATAHVVLKGDVIRFTSGTFSGREVKVQAVFDVDNFDLAETLSAAPAAAVTFEILRNKAPVINSDGTLFTSSAGDLSYKRNGVSTSVSEDTVTPANNRPLPVKLTGFTGDITVTAANLDVQLTHAGASPDSIKIGDGVDFLAINADGSINTLSAETATAADGAAAPAVFKVIAGFDGALVQAIKTDAGGELQVGVTASALPTGAATAAKQDTGNTSLSSIDGKVPANLTVTATRLLVDPSGVTSPVSAAALPLPAGAATSANQVTELASLASIDAGIPAALGQTTSAASMPVVIASDQSAIPISAASLPLPTGAATAANQATEIASLASIDGKVPANLTVTATRLLIDGSGVTQPISAAALPLPTGAATSANQTTEIASLASIDAGIPAALGSTTSAASMPVVIASDQAAIATKSPVNTVGTTVNTALTATTASSASAPANAVGFILEAPSTNTDNVRWALGTTASTTVGLLLEPGRDTGFVPCNATISICATVSGTNAFSIIWIQSA